MFYVRSFGIGHVSVCDTKTRHLAACNRNTGRNIEQQTIAREAFSEAIVRINALSTILFFFIDSKSLQRHTYAITHTQYTCTQRQTNNRAASKPKSSICFFVDCRLSIEFGDVFTFAVFVIVIELLSKQTSRCLGIRRVRKNAPKVNFNHSIARALSIRIWLQLCL